MPDLTTPNSHPPAHATLRRVIAWGCLTAAALGLGAYFTGRLLSDRWLWSQYLHWLPSVPALVGCGLAVLASRIVWRRSRRLGRARVGVAIGLVIAMAWVGVFEWRLQHVFGRSNRAAQGAGTLTVVHFNASGKAAPALVATVARLDADFIVLANLRAREGLTELRTALSKPRGNAGQAEGAGANIVHADRFSAVSRYPIVEFGRTTLGFDGEVFLNRDLPDLRDPGTAAWFRLDTKAALGRDVVVWAVDLPSDPRLGRWRVMAKTMDAIDAWAQPSLVRQDGGNYAPGAPHPPGFPAPDVIIGDFNTPGGSAAIAELGRRAAQSRGDAGRRLVDAHAAAGLGPDASFPGFLPRWLGWGIDRALVTEGFNVVGRDLATVGRSQHRAQRVIIEPAAGPRATPSAAPGS